MESRGESETQQLVLSDVDGENDDSLAQDDTVPESKIISPVRSNIISSSGNTTSQSSVSRGHHGNIIHGNRGNSKLLFINEKQKAKDYNKNSSTARPRNPHKEPISTNVRHHCFLSEVPDVRHMEKSLLGLLEDFHSGKLRAFGSGCTMEQMTNIREQQEKLAKLHFDLGSVNEPSLTDENIRKSQHTMSQLIQRLEQLSVSIEGLHTDNDKK
ncbi:coiled-coil domain-containing protein 28A isoform X1 [Onthophagus taurus]|uniref:coiled-coil domain-containing protein 28A isoform X1 n=1 Tax=Onthophagus taurus TaxID=166361 RepID=UPI000C20ED5E|nr:coiled-coil domain-containing protein 28A isoform X1 [Onthophagus taurus]